MACAPGVLDGPGPAVGPQSGAGGRAVSRQPPAGPPVVIRLEWQPHLAIAVGGTFVALCYSRSL